MISPLLQEKKLVYTNNIKKKVKKMSTFKKILQK